MSHNPAGRYYQNDVMEARKCFSLTRDIRSGPHKALSTLLFVGLSWVALFICYLVSGSELMYGFCVYVCMCVCVCVLGGVTVG